MQNKNEITKQTKDKIDYSSSPEIEQEIKLYLPENNNMNDKYPQTNEYLKPKELEEKKNTDTNDDIKIDTDIDFDQEKKTINGAKLKLEKKFLRK